MSSERKKPVILGRVKELRTEYGLTQEKFAESIQVSPNTISRIEQKNMSLSSEIALKIADKYKVSLDWLFNRSNDKLRTQDYLTVKKCIENEDIDEINNNAFEIVE